MRRRRSPLTRGGPEPAACTPALRQELVAGLPFLAGVDPEALRRLAPLFRDRGFAAGQWIYRAGDPATHLYIVGRGAVRLFHSLAGGREMVLDVLDRGEFFGHLASEAAVHPNSARAHTPCCLLAVGIGEFRRILSRYPQANLRVLELLSGRLERAEGMLGRLVADSAEGRIALVLLRLGEKFGRRRDGGLLIQIPVPRDLLAQMSGTTVETASRVVSRLQRSGIVEAGRGWVGIRDAGALAALASASS